MSAPKPVPPKPAARPSLTSLFNREQVFDQVEVSLPPLRATPAPPAPTSPVVDLSALARTWLLIARGGAGKTMLARWLAGSLEDRGMLGTTLLAAFDPMNRTLSHFFEGVQQPDSRDPAEAAALLRNMVQYVSQNPLGGVWDFGGGDLALANLVDMDSTFDRRLSEHGVGIVACYLLTPSVDDLGVLKSFEDRGFQPKATALVLNMGRAENLGEFAALRAQAAYKSALARGAVEIVMPKLEPADVALEVERKRLAFHHVRDETVPSGSKVQAIDGLNAMMVRHWLQLMDEAFAPVSSWLPWT